MDWIGMKYQLFHNTSHIHIHIISILPVNGSAKIRQFSVSYICVNLSKCSGHGGGHSCKAK